MRNIGKTFVWCQLQSACTYFVFLWTKVSISSAVREAFENLKKTFDQEIADLRSQLDNKSKWQMISVSTQFHRNVLIIRGQFVNPSL